MKLKEDFISHSVGAESFLVPTGNASWVGVVRGNKTFDAIVALLRTETTEEAVVAAMRKRFDAPDGVIEQDVAHAVAELRKIGALDE
ncbi:MAG: PqqD family protein [Atopobiaceae bacterium]|nr:PqqD family protein [Atopobiaceae bacterium]